MNKAQILAVFLTGAATGVGGVKLSQSAAPAAQIRVHALELHAGAQLPDGGLEVARRAYGTLVQVDGGARDIGAAKKCAASPERRAALAEELRAAASECVWDEP